MRVRPLVVFAVVALAVLGQVTVNWGEAYEVPEPPLVGPGEFVISYSSFIYDVGTNDLVSTCTLVVLWSGISYVNSTGLAGGDDTSSFKANISMAFARNTLEGILSEWSFDTLRRYLDLGTPSGFMEQTLDVVWHVDSLGMVFEGYSMMGVMPWTYARLQNVIKLTVMNETSPLNASLQLSTAQGPGTTTYVDAVFENNEEFNLTAAATTLDVWEGWIVRVNGRYVDSLNKDILATTWKTFTPGSVTEFEAQGWNWSGASPGFYVVMVEIVLCEYIVVTVPEGSGAVNHMPLAEFTVDPLSGNRSTVFEFDALMSWDWEDNGTEIEFRWDWNNDRRWDVEWTPARLATHEFYDEGEQTVTMQVRDSEGLVNETHMVILIEEGDDLLLIFVSAALVAVVIATLVLMHRSSKRQEP